MTKQLFYAISSLAVLMILLASCGKTHTYRERQALPEQQIPIATTLADLELWQTRDVAVRYQMVDNGTYFTLSGYVEIKDSVLYSFPRTDYFYLHVYLLDSRGYATSKHVIRPRLLHYEAIYEQGPFSQKIAKDGDTQAIAFGYQGNFFDVEFEERGGFLRRDKIDWEIFHSPFN